MTKTVLLLSIRLNILDIKSRLDMITTDLAQEDFLELHKHMLNIRTAATETIINIEDFETTS